MIIFESFFYLSIEYLASWFSEFATTISLDAILSFIPLTIFLIMSRSLISAVYLIYFALSRNIVANTDSFFNYKKKDFIR